APDATTQFAPRARGTLADAVGRNVRTIGALPRRPTARHLTWIANCPIRDSADRWPNWTRPAPGCRAFTSSLRPYRRRWLRDACAPDQQRGAPDDAEDWLIRPVLIPAFLILLAVACAMLRSPNRCRAVVAARKDSP